MFLLSVMAFSARGQMIVNEVMANTPGADSSLQWIELYNNTTGTAQLAFYGLSIFSVSDTTSVGLDGSLGPAQFLVYCTDTIRFEQHWGDSSGVWSDSPIEDYEVRQLPFGLPIPQGGVAAYRLLTLQSQLRWTQPGSVGVSWERTAITSNDIVKSQDPRGGTPGGPNSLAPVLIDLAIDEVEPRAVDGATNIAYAIVNRSLSQILGATLDLYYFDPQAPDSLGSLLASDPVGEIDSGYTIILIGQYSLPGLYDSLSAIVKIFGDERPYNNRMDFLAPGSDFPPVILSEFLANPGDGLGSEWVELKNISNNTVDLRGWRVGDSIGAVVISNQEFLVDPGEYVVLVQDSTDFLAYYSDFSARHQEPSTWRQFNNGSDSVRLIDPYGFESDAFYYTDTWENNHTWARGESEDNLNRWGRSEEVGGSPGAPNNLRLPGEAGESLEITIEPQIFAPDGNGIDDSTVITILPSQADAYTLEIYDSEGRKVRTFEDSAPVLAERYVWDGRTDGGERLPIGIYILYFESEGVESVKKTIVIAR
jgi:hypothetical protein